VKPGVKEHAAVAGREDKAVAVEPARLLRVQVEGVAEEDGADLGAAERQAEVAGLQAWTASIARPRASFEAFSRMRSEGA
jgi:hypothetical protein